MPVKRFNKSKRLKMGGRRNSKRLKMGGRRKSKRLKMGGRRKSKRLNKSKRFVRDGSRLKIGGSPPPQNSLFTRALPPDPKTQCSAAGQRLAASATRFSTSAGLNTPAFTAASAATVNRPRNVSLVP